MSSENDCKNFSDSASSKLIEESDLVIESLNSIIESHSETTVNTNKNFVQNILKKSESFRKLTSFANHKKNHRQNESSHTISSSIIEKLLSNKMETEPTISKKDKFKSKSYFINSSPGLRKSSTSDSSKKIDSRQPGTCSTSYINPSKKKRSSLFNLFSFTKSSSGSSQNIDNHASDYYNLNDYDNVFSDYEPDTNHRPQSECITSPEWHRNLKFFNNKKTYKLTEKQKSFERSSAVSLKSNDSSQCGTITKRQLVRCKGFSVPLNASYCPNSGHIRENLNLNHENKLNINLKYAEVKNLDDEFREENQNFAQEDQNNSETLDRLDINEDNENRCCSPSPSILTLSLNNKCSTATKTLDQNLNSINFVNNINGNMFTQNQTKTNTTDMSQQDTESNEGANYRKKRFQQFQTQSLIDLNVQLVKKNEQCVDNLKQNDNSTTKAIRNPLFKLNNYQTIDEDSYSKLKHFYSSSSNFFNNEAMSEINIHMSSNSKPLQKTIKLRKGQSLKDALKSFFMDMNINSDDYELYLSDNNLADLDQLCEQYFGAEFTLKKKDLIPKHDEDVPKQNITTQPTSSSINWHNYFGSKAYKNSKQKRNSCIAVMNEHSSSQTQAGSLKNSSSTSICSNYSNMAFPSPVNTSERVVRVNRGNFRRMGQIASIFASYSNSKLEPASPLNEFLELYTQQLPKLPEEFAIGPFDPAWLEIESDWYKFVGDSYAQSLPIRKAKQQMAIWELLVTECSFIKSIKIVIDVFLNCLVNLKLNEQTSQLFNDIDLKKLFCNIIEVFKCNLTLWCKYLHPTLYNLINGSSISLLIDPQFLISSFSDFKNLFQPYEEYCLEQNNSNDYLKQKASENENFAKFINWAENHPLAGRLKFSEYMIMPVQRITRYHILIDNIIQFTDDDFKREKFTYIKEIVNSLPNRINVKLGYMAQFNDISDSIEKYEGVQGQNDEINDILNQFKKFDIKSPLPGCAKTSVRELIHQGPLRLKDVPKSVDVHCFLFTDMLLITQLKKSKKYKIIKPPMQTNKMMVKELSQTDKAFICISLNDYNVPDSVYMFISNQCKKWIEFLEVAKQKYLSERQKFLNSSKIFKLETGNESETSNTTISRSFSAESNEIQSDTDRRNSSATLTENQSEATIIETVKSPVIDKKVYQKQQANGTRIFGGRLDRPRRNMTDPNQHCAEEKHPIAKRNSLNDKPGNMKPSLINQTRFNFFADSTSTILSTDSGVSNCDNNQISFSQESITKHSPVKIIPKNMSPSSPTSSSYSSASNEPIYSNLSMSSSSSSNCSKYDTIKNYKPLDEDFYEDDDIAEAEETKNSELNASTCDSNFMFKKVPNFRVKQPSSENIKLIKANFENMESKANETKNDKSKVSVRKPLIRIRPTNLKNEAVRVRSENIFCNNLNSDGNYDSSVDSALVNGLSLDNHHRMILVNLLHTTLDSTEV